MKFSFNSFVLMLKQLLPLTYRSHYRDDQGQSHFAVWRMWFGRCFDYEDVRIHSYPT